MDIIERITVTLIGGSYSITIVDNLLNNLGSFLPIKAGNQVMLVTNKTLASLYLNKIYQVLKRIGIEADSIILPDGEKYKNLTILNTIFTALLRKLHNRNTTLIALGGGVIGDLTGFAAASYQRGVRFIQIPTTLLSQVDSSIGGKASVNHPLGKNMIGAFYHPISVLIILDFLKTLPERELSSGIAEIIKYGIVMDETFFSWLEKNIDKLLCLDNNAIRYCVRRSCELKANIVAKDEREDNLRTLLNLGHTYGHAIEAKMGYKNWLHGEAVAVGIVMAARTSELLGQFTSKETQRIITLLKRSGLPIAGPAGISAKTYLPYMMRDKKVLANKLRLVLPIAIGKSKVHNEVSRDIVINAISDVNNFY